MSLFLPAEWHEQAFVQMTWPHQHTDWAPVLDDAIECFCNIAREIAQREPLLIVAQYPEEARAQLEKRGTATSRSLHAKQTIHGQETMLSSHVSTLTRRRLY